MIAQFRFSATPPDESVAVQMLRRGDKLMGVLIMPPALRDATAAEGLPTLGEHEEIGLPMVLGYAVTLCMLSERTLYLTGDQSVWKVAWGRLSASH